MSKLGKRTQEDFEPAENTEPEAGVGPQAETVFEDEMQEPDATTPSWFSNTYQVKKPDELARRYRERMDNEGYVPVPPPEAYEHYRRRIEERFQAGKRLAEQQYSAANADMPGHSPVPVRRPVARQVNDEAMRRFQIWDEQVAARQGRQVQPRAPKSSGRSRLVAGIAVACLIGSTIGYFTASGADPSQTLASVKSKAGELVVAWLAPVPIPPISTANEPPKSVIIEPTKTERSLVDVASGETVLDKKPIKIPRVTVSDASGGLNNPIPLDLAAFPASPDEPLALKVTGLPDNAYLTQGKEIAKGQWLVKAEEIAGVKLVIPTSSADQVDLSVAAVTEKTLEPAAPAQELTVALDMKDVNVLPANAPPEGVQLKEEALPQAIPLPLEVTNNEATNFLNKGEALLKTGDINSARQFLMKAFEAGEKKAAFGVGQSFDPLFYKTMKVTGLVADKAKAVEWYTKASEAGFAPAAEALQLLNQTAAQ